MSYWSDLVGTIRGYFVLGTGGVRLKNSSGALSVRNAADSADAQVVAASLKADAWYNSSGTENFKCRAWVNFNGTGTVAIRGSGNVSSITDNGTGDYTINFTNAMPDANYAPVSSGGRTSVAFGTVLGVNSSFSATTSAVRLSANTGSGTLVDTEYFYVAVFS